MVQQSGDLLERILAPLEGESPAGENARFDERYERAKAEVMKLTASAGGSGVDWKAVVDNSAELLTTKTKDLMLGAYLTLGLLRQQRYEGLALGLEVLTGLIDTFWEEMYPPARRVRARTQIFEWLDERLPPVVEDLKPEAGEEDELRRAQELANELPGKVQALIKGPVTGFSRLRTEINRHVGALPEPSAEPAETADAPVPSGEEDGAAAAPSEEQAAATPAAKAAPAPRMAVPDAPAEIASIDEGLNAIRRIVHLVRGVQPHGPVAYLVARAIKWAVTDGMPPAEPSGTTMLPGPREDALEPLSLMVKAANWKDLAEEAESLFLEPAGTFCLDLQRYVALALSNQGASEAAQAVTVETGRFLQRFPGLLELRFSSGRPFAGGETVGWCREAMDEVSGGGGQNVLAEDDGLWLKEASDKAEKRNFSEALGILQNAIDTAKGVKNSAIRRLESARLCLRFGQPQWAAPILESLSDKLDETRVSDWDLELCAEVWGALLRTYQQMGIDNQLDDARTESMRRLQKRLFDANLALAAALSPERTTD